MLKYTLRKGKPEGLKELTNELVALSDEELDEKIVVDGLLMGDERFGVFFEEYTRRKRPMPQ